MIRAALTPPWVQMSEASLPSSWAEARDVTLANAPWIFLLLAGERAVDGHYKTAGVALALCLVSFGGATHWKAFQGLSKPEGRRRLAFVFITIGPIVLATGIYMLATQQASSPANKVVEQHEQQPAAPVSEEEKHFRFELQKYVLLNIDKQLESFAQLVFPIVINPGNPGGTINKDGETVHAAAGLFDAAVRSKVLDDVNALKADVDRPIEQLDPKKISTDLKNYYRSYNQAQAFFRSFLILSGHDLSRNSKPLATWLDADDRALQASEELSASLEARKYELGGFAAAARSSFGAYLKQQGGGAN